MTDIIPLHTPKWRLVETDWCMIVGNRTVAVLMPNSCDIWPQFQWLSCFVGANEYPDYGWNNVDFETLAIGQFVLGQWWFHMLRGNAFRP